MDLVEKTLVTINKYGMLSKGDVLLIGLSGGPDSVCLSVIVDELKDNFNLTLHALYVDHGLRPDETGREAAFCKRFCGERRILFHEVAVSVKDYARDRKMNIHEAARELRYEVLDKRAVEIGAHKIAVAHNADDQAETVLMRLLRGAGRRGLSGMLPMRGRLIRPIIDIARKDIEAFLAKRNITFMNDSTNLETDYSRNWLRAEVFPLLRNLNPRVTESINRTAEVLQAEEKYLETATTKAMMRLISRKKHDNVELFLIPLMNIDKAILRRIIRRSLLELGVSRGIDCIHIDAIIRLVRENRNGDRVHLPRGVQAIKNYATLLLTTETAIELTTQQLNIPGETILQGSGLRMIAEITTSRKKREGRSSAIADYDRINGLLYVRKRRKGDYFYPEGFRRRKKLQDFFVDEKVHRELRDRVPLVVCGEDIVWIAGYRMDERFAIKKGTRRFLFLKLMPSE